MKKMKVLLVDDEKDFVKTMAERMEIRDVGSKVALSGEEALKMVKDEVPDVMVLDLRMPGINGMEVLEQVKREHPHVEVIILTGHGSEKEEKEARRLGAYEYLQKPADTNSLVETIKGAYKKSLKAAVDFLKDSREGFDRSMSAAALAQAGEPEMAREMMKEPLPGHEDTSSDPASSREDTSTRALKVLLVDDEEDFVTTMAERMEMRDVGSKVALRGEEALKMVEDEVPDVMVLDIRMPGIDGMEVLKRVKKTYPQVQVIIMTGHGSDKDEKEARKLGAFDYLNKPVDLNHLMDAIRKAGRAGGNTE